MIQISKKSCNDAIKERSKSFLTGKLGSVRASEKSVMVGKLLAGVYYRDGALTVHLNRVSGLCGGVNRQKSFNPYLKVSLLQYEDKHNKQKTSIKYNTRNPIFNETFKVCIKYCC